MRTRWTMVIVAVCVMVVAGGLYAGTDAEKGEEPATALDRFLAGHGTLLVKEFYLIGRMRPRGEAEVTVEAVRLLQPAGPELSQVLGVRVTRSPKELHESTVASFLDSDELPHALEAVAAMRDMAAAMEGKRLHATELHDTEVLYESKAGARVGFFETGYTQTAYIRVGGPVTGKTVRFRMEGLEELEGYLEAAIQKLQELARADESEQ